MDLRSQFMSSQSKRLGAAFSLAFALSASSGSAIATGEERGATALELKAAGADGTARLRMTFSSTPIYTARLERGATRLVVDVPHSTLKDVPSALLDKVGVVGGVMVQSFAAAGSRTTRLLLTPLQPSHYAVGIDGDALVIAVAKGTSGELEAVPQAAPGAATAASDEPCKVLDGRFKHATARDEVELELSRQADFKESTSSATRRTLTPACSKLTAEIKRTLEV